MTQAPKIWSMEVSRRCVLRRAACAAGAVTILGAGIDAAMGSELSRVPEGQPELRQLQAVRGPERLQERRWCDQPERLVQHLGESLSPCQEGEGRFQRVSQR